MAFNEKEIFVGIGIVIIIGGLLAILIVLNSSDDDSTSNQVTDTSNIRGITGNIINFFQGEKNYCGDGYCYINENGDYENCNICSSDCGTCGDSNKCGDKVCSNGECNTCFSDCSLLECENGVCEENKGENCENSPNDCSCTGDSYCDKGVCVSLGCGNGVCESSKGEDCQSCKQDCGVCDCSVLGGNSCEVGQICDGEDNQGCCFGTCKWKWDYPLIFVHGHSKEEEGSMFSILTFEEFQDKLISDGYYEERVPIIASNEKIDFKEKQWADTVLPISLRTTYYWGEYSVDGGFTYQDNNQRIGEYAKRLEKIIDLIRYATGREKVDIVAHSMGGLVAREYIRKTEGKYVNKLVTIGTPNNGIYGAISFGCGTILADRKYTPECEDMQHNSSFIKRLNEEDKEYRNKYLTISGKAYQQKEAILVYCPNFEDYYDEVICDSSVYLEWAKNDEVSGKRSNNKMHNDLVLPSEAEDVYHKVVEFLKN